MAAPHIEIPQPGRVDAQIIGLPSHVLKDLQAAYPDIVIFQTLTPEQRAAKIQELWVRDTQEARVVISQSINNYKEDPDKQPGISNGLRRFILDTFGKDSVIGGTYWPTLEQHVLSKFEQSVPQEAPSWVTLHESQDALGKTPYSGFGIMPKNIPYAFDHYGLVTGEPMTYAEIARQPGRTGTIANKVNKVRTEFLKESELRWLIKNPFSYSGYRRPLTYAESVALYPKGARTIAEAIGLDEPAQPKYSNGV
jgi:hypothetical protein